MSPFKGLHFADASVWITCAMALAAFNISKVVENGTVVEPVVDYTGGTIRYVYSIFDVLINGLSICSLHTLVIQSRSDAPSSRVPRKRRRWFWLRSSQGAQVATQAMAIDSIYMSLFPLQRDPNSFFATSSGQQLKLVP